MSLEHLRYGGGLNRMLFGNTPVYGPKSTLMHYGKNLVGVHSKGFGVGTVLGNIPDRMYPINKSLFRDRKVINMPGKLEFKRKPIVKKKSRVSYRSKYLLRRFKRYKG
jgi:hypothetical protein